jgi:flagellar hook assembly protein FlgD
MKTGVYNISWDGTDFKGKQVGSGVYFVRLQAGKQVQTAKLLRIN